MSRFELDISRLHREVPVAFLGPSGRLEGLWRAAPADTVPAGVAIVSHPHPQHGGTMLNKVVFHLARVLNHDLGLATLRFNFRGTGASDGTYDHGLGEQDDVRYAWREARHRVPRGALVAAGFSFGAAMTLAVAAERSEDDPEPTALALIGIPLRLFPFPDPVAPAPPLAAVHGGADEFIPPEPVADALRTWPAEVAFHVEPGADHFLTGRLPETTSFLSRTLMDWLDLPTGSSAAIE